MFISTQCSVVLAFIKKDQWVLGGYKKLKKRGSALYTETSILNLRNSRELFYTDDKNYTLDFMLGLSKLEKFLVRRAFSKAYDKTMVTSKDQRVSSNRREVIDIITGMKDND